MSSVTSLAGYNGTGTQGTAVTNKLADNLRSVFWNENNTNKTLIYGSSLIECTGNVDDVIGSTKTWVIDNTPDIIGDLYLRIKVPIDGTTETTNPRHIPQVGLLNLIERIDIKVGSQIWQSINRETLYNLLITELSSNQFNDMAETLSGVNSKSTDGPNHIDEKYGGYTSVITSVGTNSMLEPEAFIPLLMFTKNYTGTKTPFNSINESGYLSCAAPDQQFSVQLFLSNGKTHWLSAQSTNSSPRSNSAYAKEDTVKVQTQLYYRQIMMSNIERSSIVNAPSGIPMRIKLTQEIPNIDVNSKSLRIDCSRFNIFGSHIIVNMPLRPVESDWGKLLVSKHRINFELTINGTSLFGVMPGSAFISNVSGHYLGLEHNVAKLSTNSTQVTGQGQEFSLFVPSLNWTYVIPLASTAYGGSSLPLNRFDNIILSITEFEAGEVKNNKPVFATNGATVTCVGESVAIYKDGGASISTF